MFRFDRIGTPRIHGGALTLGSSTSTSVNSNLTTAQTFVGHAVNVANPGLSGREVFHWDASLTLPINNKFFVGHQFFIPSRLPDNSHGVELSGSLHCTLSDFIEVTPFFGKLSASGASVLANVTLSEYPTFLSDGRQAAGTTLRARTMSHATPVNLVSQDAAGTYIHGWMFSGRDAAAGTIDRMHMRFAFRTGEPDPATKDFDIRR